MDKPIDSSNDKKAASEPPMFNIDQLPEPPKLDKGKDGKKGFFSKIIGKKDDTKAKGNPDLTPSDIPAPPFPSSSSKAQAPDVPMPPSPFAELDSKLNSKKDKGADMLPPPPLPKDSMPGSGLFAKLGSKEKDDYGLKMPDIKSGTQGEASKPALPDFPSIPPLPTQAPPAMSKKDEDLLAAMPLPPKLGDKSQSKKAPASPVEIPPIPKIEPVQPAQAPKKDDFVFPMLPKKGDDIKLSEPPKIGAMPELPGFSNPAPKVEISPEDEEIHEILGKMKEESPEVESELEEIEEMDEDKKEEEMIEEDALEVTTTPLSDIKGIGDTRQKELKKIGIKDVETLAEHDHEHIAKKTSIPVSHAKKIIAEAKKIKARKMKEAKASARKRKLAKKLHVEKVKIEKSKTEQDISSLIKELESEKSELKKLQDTKEHDIEMLPKIKGHDQIIVLLEQLEKKKLELVEYENELRNKEGHLESHKEKYQRDYEHIENLKRRLDHDVRERTQYLIDLEKDFFKKGQDLAKTESVLKIRQKDVDEKIKIVTEKEKLLKKMEHELHDREITTSSKEQKLQSLMKELQTKEDILKNKESRIEKMEHEAEKKLEALEKHEKEAKKDINEKREMYEKKLKELEAREAKIEKKKKLIDIEERALDYAENEIESEREKLEDDEFQQYLHEKIGLVKETNMEITNIEKAKSIHVPDLQDRPQTIHDMIDSCRRLTKQGRVTEAKIFYNKARESFYGQHFKSHQERDDLHNVLRELYDEINLTGM